MWRKHFQAAFGGLAVLVAFALPGPVVSVAAATADSVVPPTCQAAFGLDLNPALTPGNTVDAQGNAVLLGCQFLTDNGTTLLSGTVTGSSSSATANQLNCLLFTITGSARFVWNTENNTRKTTDFDFVINSDPTNGTITLSATSTGGAAHPFSITALPITPVIEGTCQTGIKRLFTLNAEIIFS